MLRVAGALVCLAGMFALARLIPRSLAGSLLQPLAQALTGALTMGGAVTAMVDSIDGGFMIGTIFGAMVLLFIGSVELLNRRTPRDRQFYRGFFAHLDSLPAHERPAFRERYPYLKRAWDRKRGDAGLTAEAFLATQARSAG